MIIEIHYIANDIREKVITIGDKCTIGRSPKNDIQIDLECFSRQHLEIQLIDTDYFITDLNSTNGVYYNNEKLDAGKMIRLQPYFPIEIGQEIAIYFGQEGQQSPDNPAPRSHHPRTLRKEGSRSKTKTRNMKSTPSAGSTKKGLIVFTCIIIAGYAWLLNSSDKSTSIPLPSTEAQVLIPVTNISTEELNNFSENKCHEFKELCEELKFKQDEERISYSEDKLFLHINYEEFIRNRSSDHLLKEPKESQVEYALSYYAFHPEVINAAKANNNRYVVVSGVDKELAKTKYSVILDVTKINAPGKEEHESFFSSLFYGGIFRPYRKQLQPFIRFSTY
jgi:pSer/pThr/pTyr-binding forkhead associated (FHA) protein